MPGERGVHGPKGFSLQICGPGRLCGGQRREPISDISEIADGPQTTFLRSQFFEEA
jgi:hypothetical protein